MTEACGGDGLKRAHTHTDFLYYKLVTAVPFFTALAGIWRAEPWNIAPYVVWFGVHMLTVYRILCTHCPHYGSADGKTNCHFIWKAPKLFHPRPGPQSIWSKLGLVLMLMISSLLPVYWLAEDWALLVIYFLSLGVLFTTMMKYECTRCIHLDCPKNQVPQEVREMGIAKE